MQNICGQWSGGEGIRGPGMRRKGREEALLRGTRFDLCRLSSLTSSLSVASFYGFSLCLSLSSASLGYITLYHLYTLDTLKTNKISFYLSSTFSLNF